MLAAFTALALLFMNQVPAPPTIERAPERLAAIRDVLEYGLVDYPSARFRDVRVVHRPSNRYVTLAVCGLVNSRNRDGGYIGWTRFVILDDELEMATDSLGRRAVAVWCDGSDVLTVDPDITPQVSPGS